MDVTKRNIVQFQIINKTVTEVIYSLRVARYQMTQGLVPVRVPGVGTAVVEDREWNKYTGVFTIHVWLAQISFCWGGNMPQWKFWSCIIRPVCARWVRGSSSCCLSTATWAEVFSCTAWLPWSRCCSASLTPCFTSPTSHQWCPSSSSDPRVFRWPRWLCVFIIIIIFFWFSQSSTSQSHWKINATVANQ